VPGRVSASAELAEVERRVRPGRYFLRIQKKLLGDGMNAAPQSIRHRWIIVASLFALFAVNFADKAVIGLAAEPIMRELGLSHSAFGRIAGSFFVLFSVMGLIVGVISDHLKTRWR
jgi:sugar phosphate permease